MFGWIWENEDRRSQTQVHSMSHDTKFVLVCRSWSKLRRLGLNQSANDTDYGTDSTQPGFSCPTFELSLMWIKNSFYTEVLIKNGRVTDFHNFFAVGKGRILGLYCVRPFQKHFSWTIGQREVWHEAWEVSMPGYIGPTSQPP